MSQRLCEFRDARATGRQWESLAGKKAKKKMFR